MLPCFCGTTAPNLMAREALFLLTELYSCKTDVQLGEGAFGKVRLATSTRTAHRVAVKVIKRKKLNERAELLLQREVKHHEKLRHENIVRLHTFIMTPNK